MKLTQQQLRKLIESIVVESPNVKTVLRDADTGKSFAVYADHLPVGKLRVEFGNHFSLTLAYDDWNKLFAVVQKTIDDGGADDEPEFSHR